MAADRGTAHLNQLHDRGIAEQIAHSLSHRQVHAGTPVHLSLGAHVSMSDRAVHPLQREAQHIHRAQLRGDTHGLPCTAWALVRPQRKHLSTRAILQAIAHNRANRRNNLCAAVSQAQHEQNEAARDQGSPASYLGSESS